MQLWIRTHWIIQKLFPQFVWSIPTKKKTVYLTFDDGPIPQVTEFVLEQLQLFDAKATFFCIGNNIQKHPEIFKRLVADGHAFGNHTFNHLKGWKTPLNTYLENVALCENEINSLTKDNKRLLRPPYAKITLRQARALREQGYKIVMWDVLSADFNPDVSPQQCLKNVIQNIRPGSIIIFHDSLKAFRNMEYALPRTLEYLKENGYTCEVLD